MTETKPEISAEQKEYAQQFMNTYIQALVARGLTAWPAFTVPGTNVEVGAGRVPGTLVKTAEGYTVLPNGRKR